MVQLRKVVAVRGDVFELRHQLLPARLSVAENSRTYGPSLLNSRSLAPWAVPAPLNARIWGLVPKHPRWQIP